MTVDSFPHSFGTLLRMFRRRATNHLGGSARLTQGGLADRLYEVTGVQYTTASVSAWERDKQMIHHDDRLILAGIIHVLVICGGLFDLEEANSLLAAGNYHPLRPNEIQSINHGWGRPKLQLSSQKGSEMPKSSDDQGQFNRDDVHAATRRVLSQDNFSPLVIIDLPDGGAKRLAERVMRELHANKRFNHRTPLILSLADVSADAQIFEAQIAQVIEQVGRHLSPRSSTTLQTIIKAVTNKPLVIVLTDVPTGMIRQVVKDKSIAPLAQSTPCLFTSTYAPLSLKPIFASLKYRDAAEFLAARLSRTNHAHFEAHTPYAKESFLRLLGGHVGLLKDAAHSLNDGETFSSIREALTSPYPPLRDPLDALDQHLETLIAQLTHHAKQLLYSLYLFENGSGSMSDVMAVSEIPSRDFHAARRELASYALLVQSSDQTKWIALESAVYLVLHRSTYRPTPDLMHTRIGSALKHWATIPQPTRESMWLRIDQHFPHWLRLIAHILDFQFYEQAHEANVLALTHTLYRYVQRRGNIQQWASLLGRLLPHFEWHDSAALSRVWCQYGRMLQQIHDREGARVAFHRAKLISLRLNDVGEIGRTHYHRAAFLHEATNWEAAAEALQHAQTAFTKVGNQTGLAACDNLLGRVAADKGQWQLAEQLFMQALERVTGLNNGREMVRMQLNISRIYLINARYQDMLSILDEADMILRLHELQIPATTAQIHLFQAEAFMGLEQWSDAEARLGLLDQTLLFRLEETGQWGVLGRYYWQLAKLEEHKESPDKHVISLLTRSYQLWLTPEHSSENMFIAEVLLMRARIEAKSTYAQAHKTCLEAMQAAFPYRHLAIGERLYKAAKICSVDYTESLSNS